MQKKIVILSTDTLHHRYFINYLEQHKHNILKYIFETNSINFKFKTGPTIENKQHAFEKENFFKDIPINLNKKKIQYAKNINSKIVFKSLKKIKPDLGIVFGTRKINKNIINLFKDGLINCHRGDPKDYRGLDSDFWAMYHNDFKNISSTIHFIDTQLDTGDIIETKRLKLNNNIRAYNIQFHTTKIMAKLSLKALNLYYKNNLKSFKQKTFGRYYSKMPIDIKKISIKKFDDYCKRLK